MSTTDGDASSRLDDALADVFEKAPLPAVTPSTDDDWNVDGPDDDYELPEIVPATAANRPSTQPQAAAPAAAPPAVRPAAPATSPPVAPATAPRAASTTAATTPATAPATSWGDHMGAIPASAQGAALRAPGRRPRVRRVTRVLRHIDPWSTFKVALLFSVVAYLVALTAGVLLWRVADSTGTLANVERWFTQFGWETFELKGGEIFHNAWIIGLFGAVALTGGLVLLATLFNLVSDIVGGVRLTVLEEEVVERTVSSTRRYVVRRTPVAGNSGDDADDWAVDGEGDDLDRAHSGGSAPAGAAPAVDDWSIDDDDDSTSGSGAPQPG